MRTVSILLAISSRRKTKNRKHFSKISTSSNRIWIICKLPKTHNSEFSNISSISMNNQMKLFSKVLRYSKSALKISKMKLLQAVILNYCCKFHFSRNIFRRNFYWNALQKCLRNDSDQERHFHRKGIICNL